MGVPLLFDLSEVLREELCIERQRMHWEVLLMLTWMFSQNYWWNLSRGKKCLLVEPQSLSSHGMARWGTSRSVFFLLFKFSGRAYWDLFLSGSSFLQNFALFLLATLYIYNYYNWSWKLFPHTHPMLDLLAWLFYFSAVGSAVQVWCHWILRESRVRKLHYGFN